MRRPIVGELPRRVIVMHKHAQARSRCGGRPLEHFEVTVRVAEGGDRPLADELVDSDRLACPVVDEVDFRQPNDHRLAVTDFVLRLDAGPDDLLGRHAVQLLGDHAQEVDASARHGVRLESVRAQVLEQLAHWRAQCTACSPSL